MAFFLTMPISRITPISAMMVSGVFSSISSNSAPMPADGNGGDDGNGMNGTLVENAKHDINRRERRGDQQEARCASED